MQRAETEGASGAAPDAVPDVTAAQPAEQAPANALWTDKYRPGSAEEVFLLLSLVLTQPLQLHNVRRLT